MLACRHMRALLKAEAAPGLTFTDLPEPTPASGEVKVRVLRTGICGTCLLYTSDAADE